MSDETNAHSHGSLLNRIVRILHTTLSIAHALRILAKTVVQHHQREEEESEQDQRNEDPVPLKTRQAARDFHLILRDHTFP